MNRKEMILVGSVVAFISLLANSCKKDSETNTPTVSISDTAQAISESSGTVHATINLTAAASTDITIEYTLAGTAVLNGDYQVDTASPVTIPAGSTSATIQFTIFNDAVIESDKTIEITLTSGDDVNFSSSKEVITINDDETDRSEEGLQTDLVWDAGSMVDMNLYVANNVVFSGDTATDYNLVSGSENENGFESVFIDNEDADDEYYIVVSYNSGSRDVNFALTWNGPSIDNVTQEDSFTAADEGYAIFWGPIVKNGSSYGRLSHGTFFDLKNVKPHVYMGKILK